ncbi:MAG TPA: prepilin-type N-terminal cleavage/methylation domain-containing protein [Acidimicrobiales bacterium]|nr:prepilin-type N-terminal cleavage/methylation domain-containing protein [Acidimicrobiales bacterium]
MTETETPTFLQRMVAKRNEGGFTLIELLIVIVILAILAAIVVFAVGSTNQNAVAASCNADAKSVETAMEAYKAQTGQYPSSISALTVSTQISVNGVSETVGPWLKTVPGSSHYQISIDTSGDVFLLKPNANWATGNSDNYDDTPGVCNNFS